MGLWLQEDKNNSAQEQKNNPDQVCVSGEGKIKTRPDQAIINIAIESKGAKAADVKKENDAATDKVLQFIKTTY